MLTEKLANTLTAQQLRELIKKEGYKANRNLRNIRKAGLDAQSLVMERKYDPYLRKHGRTDKQGEKVFSTSFKKSTRKSTLVRELLNIQSFNREIGTKTRLQKKVEKYKKRLDIEDEDVKKVNDLLNYGYDAVGFRIDSQILEEIITNRVRAGQSKKTIKEAIRRATALAENADDYLDILSRKRGGKWI